MSIDFDDFDTDLKNDGFHIFSKEKSKIKGFYPSNIPDDFHELSINDLKIDDIITIRAYFVISKKPVYQVDSGKIDLEIEHIEGNTVFANILTELPPSFSLSKGTTIELDISEIIYKK